MTQLPGTPLLPQGAEEADGVEDLVAVEGDPTRDISALRRVRFDY